MKSRLLLFVFALLAIDSFAQGGDCVNKITCSNIFQLFNALADRSVRGTFISDNKWQAAICLEGQTKAEVDHTRISSADMDWVSYYFGDGISKELARTRFEELKSLVMEENCLPEGWFTEEESQGKGGRVFSISEGKREGSRKTIDIGFNGEGKDKYYAYIMITLSQ